MLAKIYRPAKNAMQSGKGGAQRWVLEFEPAAGLLPDELMGWTSSTDTSRQVRISFDTQEQAVAFARNRNLPHRVMAAKEPLRIIKAYSDNFAFARREPWSH